jgi:hypothetical protein
MNQNLTQTGNPHGLTVNQHIFPQFCIKRFSDSSGKVSFYDKQYNRTSKQYPKNHRFCGQRVWNENQETGFMKSIEDDYLSVINRVYHQVTYQLQPEDHYVITSMFFLWKFRQYRTTNPIPNTRLKGILTNGLSASFTLDQREQAEKVGVTIIDDNGWVNSRDMTGDNIQLQVMHYRNHYKNMRWGVLHSQNAEFLVPDTYDDVLVLPVSPFICFVLNFESALVTDQHVYQINKIAVSKSQKYYFARDFSKCFSDSSLLQD